MTKNEIRLFEEMSPVRGQFYELFARLFAQVPNLEDIEALRHLFSQLADGMPGSSHIAQGLEQLQEWYDSHPPHQWAAAAAGEHTRRFCLGGSSVMPTASVFTSEEKSQKKQVWVDLCDFYRQHDYELVEKSLLEDHISTLFFFMSTLCRETETSFDVQQQCLYRFILPWINDFCDQLSQHCAEEGPALYGGVSTLVAGFINLECLIFELAPEHCSA